MIEFDLLGLRLRLERPIHLLQQVRDIKVFGFSSKCLIVNAEDVLGVQGLVETDRGQVLDCLTHDLCIV